MPPGQPKVADRVQRERLDKYLDCLEHWGARINLTAADSRGARFETLVAPVLGAEAFVSGDVIDVGSGNGSPGLVLAVLRPDLQFTLLEPRAKRWAFLKEAAREIGASNVRVERARSDEYKGPPASTVTMRAVGLNPMVLKPLVVTGGCVLVFGGPSLEGTETFRLASGARVQRVCFT